MTVYAYTTSNSLDIVEAKLVDENGNIIATGATVTPNSFAFNFSGFVAEVGIHKYSLYLTLGPNSVVGDGLRIEFLNDPNSTSNAYRSISGTGASNNDTVYFTPGVNSFNTQVITQ